MMDLLDCAEDPRRGALDGPAYQVPWAADIVTAWNRISALPHAP